MGSRVIQRVVENIGDFIRQSVPSFFVRTCRAGQGMEPETAFGPMAFLEQLAEGLQSVGPIRDCISRRVRHRFF